MRTLKVDLGARSYPIHIGPGVIADAALYRDAINDAKVLLVTNSVVDPLYGERVRHALSANALTTLVLGDGEATKTLTTLGQVFDAAIAAGLARDGVIVALGGGVVGDIAGFAAACYQRGIRYLQVPTTLLAQVDSSVGGKTAVNHPGGKNMLGAFHQPIAVIADVEALQSLPRREFAAGLAEVVKYGLIRDPDFFEWIEGNVEALMGRDADALIYAVERSCQNKAEVVAADEREHDQRALLNLGHTFGHAIEAGVGYGVWLHGEAVAAGMCMAADLSCRLGWLEPDVAARAGSVLSQMGLPIRAPSNLSRDYMLSQMGRDKKVLAGRLRLVLLRGLGKAVVSNEFDLTALNTTLDTCREHN